jgi:3-dehydroquinate synthase
MVGPGLVAGAGSILSGLGWKTPPIVITNRTVLALHGKSLMPSLENAYGPVPVIRIGDGERFKNHATLMKIYREMFRLRADRRSWILAFGGGVVGDISGYAAATFMRGIRFVMVPTTLLSQIDSSVGGKVAVNVPEGKNLIGAFHQPAAVLSDTDVLRTLSRRELSSGLYEVIKQAAILSERLIRYLEARLEPILECRTREMTHTVAESVRIKAEVVALDEKEDNLRMVLNFGHTVGHALETGTRYTRFKHGEAVAWGMLAAIGFGRELGFLTDSEAGRLTGLIRRVGPLPSLKGLRFRQMWEALARDKKFKSGNIQMVFLKRPGEAEIVSGIDPGKLRNFLRNFLPSESHPRIRRSFHE